MGGKNKARDITVLDNERGRDGYTRAMAHTLDSLRKAGYPEPQERNANMLIIESAKYFMSLMPEINDGDMASLFGAAMGLGFAELVEEGHVEMDKYIHLVEIFHIAFLESIERGRRICQEAKLKQAAQGNLNMTQDETGERRTDAGLVIPAGMLAGDMDNGDN